MFYVLLVVGLALASGIYFRMRCRELTLRVQGLERNLQHISDMMTQMAEIQVKSFQKNSAGIEALEERMMELSMPSENPRMPLERRHQVLTLSRQGVPLEDIVKRLKAPIGEAEVILNLQKYMAGQHSRSLTANRQVKNHA